MQQFELIQEMRRDGVRVALQSAFGTNNVGVLEPIIRGASGAQIFRFDFHERAHLLRIEPERVALHDRQRNFACMTAAASAGIAPMIHYADPGNGVVIMDFIASQPLSEHPGQTSGLVRALGALIAKVQTLPLLPSLGLDYLEAMDYMLAELRPSVLLMPGQSNALMEGLTRIKAALLWDASKLVSSHNDPNMRNILFDGERLWLIDWEMAFRNDPLVDIAILTNEFELAGEQEDVLLESAFGMKPDRRLRGRLHVIRLLTRLFYGCAVLTGPVRTLQSIPDVGFATSSPIAFLAAVTDGRLQSGTPELAYAFGQMSLNGFIDGLAAPGFDDALNVANQDLSFRDV